MTCIFCKNAARPALPDIKNLRSILRKRVDLLTARAISKYFMDEDMAQAEYIYEK